MILAKTWRDPPRPSRRAGPDLKEFFVYYFLNLLIRESAKAGYEGDKTQTCRARTGRRQSLFHIGDFFAFVAMTVLVIIVVIVAIIAVIAIIVAIYAGISFGA